MKIEIEYNPRLIDGEATNSRIEIIETKKTISISRIRTIENNKLKEAIYLQIGNFLEKDFKDYELTDATIYIKDN